MGEKKLIIDFHTHILPGADHGSDSIQTSLAQLKMMSESGTDVIVATSHYYPHLHTVTSYIKLRNRCIEKLLQAKRDSPFGILLIPGAEVLVCEQLDKMKGLEELCIKGTNTLLLEMPFKPFCDELVQTVRDISKMGFRVVLAHIDRYDLDDILDLIENTTIKAQLNTEKLKVPKERKKYMPLMENGTVVALGSDIHGDKNGSYKHFKKVYELLGDDGFKIMNRAKQYIDNGEKINI